MKGRNNFRQYVWEEELYKYTTAVFLNDKNKMPAINGMPDDTHILLGLNPAFAISGLVKNIKRVSSDWINEKVM